MNWHSKTPDETELLLQTNVNRGLDELEAEKRLEENGENTIGGEIRHKSFIKKFFEQLNVVMIIILLAAAAASFGV